MKLLRELLAIVHCLKLWQHYLLDSLFVVKTENIAVSHFMTQQKLTSRQAHWQELLVEFHFVLGYWAGSSNHVADALSRRADLGLVHLVEQGKAQQFWLEDGLLMTKGNRLYVPKGGDLRKSLILECHNTLWAGHQGRGAHLCVGAEGLLLAADTGRYRDVRPHLFDLSAGQGRPLFIPKRPWESVSMDYIFGLSKVDDLDSIIVVVDQLSKYATFIAAPKHVTAEGTAHLFFKHIVKCWSLPKDIVTDRDSHFTGVFWTELFKILGSKLSMSLSYHPQSNGQTEHFNSMLEEYLRHFVLDT
ncbi:UNVERIFIED_CONTAM: hypothetical protein Sradi_1777000 [Sesamum radiatum]|uniref:Integrase catalytic domain-containing protein n=1 Tax=Sesamum radiatum TaxID=300843 RepID=A0AAW2TU17_SESRA